MFNKLCRNLSHENEDGFKTKFLIIILGIKFSFIWYVFTSYFEVIEDKKKELKISNKIKFKISKDQENLLFRYV